MIKFNEKNIVTGYIKQLLHSFNLPTMKVFKDESECYPGQLYIKDCNICLYDYDYQEVYTNPDGSEIADGEPYIPHRSRDGFIYKKRIKVSNKPSFKKLKPYIYNKFDANYTRTLKINTLAYDSHTHEYLGEYLRFIRDYHNLDLMSLYNCFSDNIPDNLDVIVPLEVDDNGKITKLSNFSYSDHNYKTYMIPVKLNSTYKIALDSNSPVEMFCGYYDNRFNYSLDIRKISYKNKPFLSFDEPFIYNTLNMNDLPESLESERDSLIANEKYLKLFIKIPYNNDSSIVVLENSRTNDADLLFGKKKNVESGEDEYNPFDPKYTETIINYKSFLTNKKVPITNESGEEKLIDINIKYDMNNIPIVTRSQLLFLNTKQQHPFADRLMEYLTNSAITHIDPISDNIYRLQLQLIDNRDVNKKTPGLEYLKHKGIWEPKYKGICYDIAKNKGLLKSKFDVLGYVDKDLEIKLGPEPDIYDSLHENIWYDKGE